MLFEAQDVGSEDFTSQVEQMIGEALRSGLISPGAALEVIYYAAERDLLEALRLFAALTPGDRARTMAFGQGLRCQKPVEAAH